MSILRTMRRHRLDVQERARFARHRKAETFWNGEPCQARRVLIVVGDNPNAPRYWAREHIGQVRAAVEVTYSEHTFYLDNADGSGWAKVTKGHGSPYYGHRELIAARVLED